MQLIDAQIDVDHRDPRFGQRFLHHIVIVLLFSVNGQNHQIWLQRDNLLDVHLGVIVLPKQRDLADVRKSFQIHRPALRIQRRHVPRPPHHMLRGISVLNQRQRI